VTTYNVHKKSYPVGSSNTAWRCASRISFNCSTSTISAASQCQNAARLFTPKEVIRRLPMLCHTSYHPKPFSPNPIPNPYPPTPSQTLLPQPHPKPFSPNLPSFSSHPPHTKVWSKRLQAHPERAPYNMWLLGLLPQHVDGRKSCQPWLQVYRLIPACPLPFPQSSAYEIPKSCKC
jgi:hypothetical protein